MIRKGEQPCTQGVPTDGRYKKPLCDLWDDCPYDHDQRKCKAQLMYESSDLELVD